MSRFLIFRLITSHCPPRRKPNESEMGNAMEAFMGGNSLKGFEVGFLATFACILFHAYR